MIVMSLRCLASRTVRTPGVCSAVATGSVEPPDDEPPLELELLPHAPIAIAAPAAKTAMTHDRAIVLLQTTIPPLARPVRTDSPLRTDTLRPGVSDGAVAPPGMDQPPAPFFLLRAPASAPRTSGCSVP